MIVSVLFCGAGCGVAGDLDACASFLLCCYCVCLCDAHAAWRCAPLSNSVRAALVLARRRMGRTDEALRTRAPPHAAAQRTAAAQLEHAAVGVARHAGQRQRRARMTNIQNRQSPSALPSFPPHTRVGAVRAPLARAPQLAGMDVPAFACSRLELSLKCSKCATRCALALRPLHARTPLRHLTDTRRFRCFLASLHSLADKDLLSKSDPVCMLQMRTGGPEQPWVNVGRTGAWRACANVREAAAAQGTIRRGARQAAWPRVRAARRSATRGAQPGVWW
jgi:hypothetical protein